MKARLSQEHVQSLVSILASFTPGRAVFLKSFQRLFGIMAAAEVVCRLGHLHARPLQLSLKAQVPRRAWRDGWMHIMVTHRCTRILASWVNTNMYELGVQTGRLVSRKVVTTDTLLMGW